MSDSVGIIGVGDTSNRLVFLLAGQSNMAGRTDSWILHSACVSSARLGDKGDCKHFDTLAQREFGRRYAEAFLKTVAAETMGI